MWEAIKTGLQLAGSRIDFNQGAPLAGYITPCVVVWDRSGSISGRTAERSRDVAICRVTFEVQGDEKLGLLAAVSTVFEASQAV